jgi:hypothetical protein
MDSAFFENQKIKMQVSQPFVDGRADGALWLNYDDATIDPVLSDCVYPVSQYITKEVDGCRDVWSFAIPWKVAKGCKWNTSNDESYLVYRGRVIVHNQEWVGLGQWRIIRSILRIKLRFQRLVSVESPEIGVVGKNIQRAAITKQIVALSLGDPALIELGTTVPWPYQLKSFTMGIFPTTKVANWAPSSDNCTSTQGQECRQNWRTSLTLFDGVCTLDGVYTLNFTVGCGPDAQGNLCPLDLNNPADTISSVQYTLKSENFCAELLVDVGIAGNIKPYSDQSFATPKITFVVNTKGFYLVKVNSDLNEPKGAGGATDPDLYTPGGAGIVVTFAKVEVINVAVRINGSNNPIRIYENKAPVSSATWITRYGVDYKADCQVHTTKTGGASVGENAIGFSFNYTRALINPPKNGKTTFTVLADVQVTYSNTSKKRFLLQSPDSDNKGFDATNDLDDDGTGTDGTATGNTTPTGNTNTGATQQTKETDSSNAAALIATLLMMIVALLI